MGRMTAGSGYCVGIVVESRMGKGISLRTKRGNMGLGTSMEGGNGMEDVWIIGEPFFRDVQVAFNVSLDPSTLPEEQQTNLLASGRRRRLVCRGFEVCPVEVEITKEKGDNMNQYPCLQVLAHIT